MRHTRIGGLAEAIILGGTVPSGPSLWPLDPGNNIPSSPTWTTLLLGSVTGSGSGLGESTFHPTYGNRVCYCPDGSIIAVFNNRDDTVSGNDHVLTKFMVVRITAPYTSYTTLFTTDTMSEQTIGMCPTINCDKAGNIYLILNQYPRGSGSSATKVYKIASPYTSASLIYSNTKSSNKYAHFFDQYRQWLWMSWWEGSSVPGDTSTLIAIDLNGNVMKSIQLWNTPSATDRNGSSDLPFAGPELYGWVTYHTIHVNHSNGEMFVGYVAEASERLAGECFYMSSHIYSPDPGASSPVWYGKNGALSLPVYADDSGPSNKTGFPWVEQGTFPASGTADFLNGADAAYPALGGSLVAGHYNWNHPNSMAWNKGALHVQYVSTGNPFGGPHHPYKRWNRSTGLVDYKRWPDFNSDSGVHTGAGVASSFTQGTSQNGPLFFVTTGRADQSHLDQLMVLRCNDTTATTPVWNQHGGFSGHLGQSPNNDGVTGNGLTNVCASTWMGPDGSINVVCGQADDGGTPGTGYQMIYARLA